MTSNDTIMELDRVTYALGCILMQKATEIAKSVRIAEDALLQAWEGMAKLRCAGKEEIKETLRAVLRRWDEFEKEIKDLEKG